MNENNTSAGWIIGVSLALAAGFGIWSSVDPEVHRTMDARNACEQRIRIFSGSSAVSYIGRVRPAAEGAHFLVLRWTPEDLQLQSRPGELIGQSAVCAFNTRTREIEQFALF